MERMVHHMAVVVLPIHTGAGIVQMLPWAAAQPGRIGRILLGMERGLVFDQQVGNLPRRNLHPDVLEPCLDFGLGHLAGKGEHEGEGADTWPTSPGITQWQVGHVGFALGR